MRRLAALTLLAASILATTQAAQQSLEMISKLRGFSTAAFAQQPQGYSLSTNDAKAVVSYRRLTTSTTEADASAKANQVGASVRKAIKQLRGGTDKFYQDLITAVKIKLCEKDLATNEIRFVSCDADNAYKDDNGDPVRLPVSSLTDDDTVKAYNQGLCEVKPNCYWAAIEDGDTARAKVYADPDSTMDSSGADSKIKEWATGVIGFVIPGIVLGVLSLLTMVFFLICRCCCNRCGGRYPREEGYTCMQKFLPLLFFLLFAIGVIVVSAAAFLYRGTMLSAVDDMFNATSGTLQNGSDWIVTIRDPLADIGKTVTGSADKITKQLAGTGFIDTGLSNITTQLDDIGNKYSTDPTFPSSCTPDTTKTNEDANGNPCYECTTCSAIGTQAHAASTQIGNNAGPGVKQLSTVKSQLNTELVDISGTVESAVDTQVSTANDLITTVKKTQDDVDKYDSKFQTYRNDLGYAIMALFALALVVIAIGFIGILFGLTPLKILANFMNIAYFLGFIALFLTFIISAIVLAIGVVLGDACEVTMIFSTNWTVPLGDSAKAVDACFQNESLLDVFNLSSKLNFARGGIDFPDLNTSAMFDFSELDALSDTANAMNASAFGFDETQFGDLLAAFNGYASQPSNAYCKPDNTYTAENLLQPWVDNTGTPAHTTSQSAEDFITTFYSTNWDSTCTGGDGDNGKSFACTSHSNPCLFSEFMGEQFQALFDLATFKKSMDDYVAGLKSDVAGIKTTTDTFETDTKGLNDNINNIKDDLNASLIKDVIEFEDAMYCTFIADGFWTIYNALCGDLMPSITMIALMLFLCGIFLIPVNVCLIIGVKRLKAHGNGHIMDTEMKFK
ncbi:Betaine aldehyde dehydrogenase [Phytophthora cinnamomi]|uniref:Betaine aldehyde dehydrogenase n=1 Tax=Phytophthora cinnamomi TaxID=4785 RepID=UPI00355A9A15|nr:Betaine aldehyde dehydrogenase [Phytophthora cinnamomi]